MSARRALRAGVAVLGLAGAVLAVEVAVTVSREYLPASSAPPTASTTGGAGTPLRLVLLGDSTTAGVGATDTSGTLGASLAARLAERLGRPVAVTSVGVSGARSEDVRGQVDEALAARPDLAVVVVGANDTTHLTPLGTVRREVAATVDALRAARVPVLVGSCPDMGAATALPRPLRDLAAWRGRAVGTVTRRAARAAGAEVVDLAAETGPAFRAAPERYLSQDRFHPSDAGYALWADALAPGAERAVRG